MKFSKLYIFRKKKTCLCRPSSLQNYDRDMRPGPKWSSNNPWPRTNTARTRDLNEFSRIFWSKASLAPTSWPQAVIKLSSVGVLAVALSALQREGREALFNWTPKSWKFKNPMKFWIRSNNKNLKWMLNSNSRSSKTPQRFQTRKFWIFETWSLSAKPARRREAFLPIILKWNSSWWCKCCAQTAAPTKDLHQTKPRKQHELAQRE